MKYIESLREGEKVNEVYLCKFKQAALTKAGKAYNSCFYAVFFAELAVQRRPFLHI